MYKVITNRESVPRQYADELIDQGLLTEDDVKKEKEAHTANLMDSFRAVDSTPPVANHLNGYWKGFVQAPAEVQRWDTGCDISLLKYIGAASVANSREF
ncbi:putative 2-oxoglutarate dehydrogenase E1 component DHKTD1, mitochondrial, partial [Parelaphostrongylus tenuis]